MIRSGVLKRHWKDMTWQLKNAPNFESQWKPDNLKRHLLGSSRLTMQFANMLWVALLKRQLECQDFWNKFQSGSLAKAQPLKSSVPSKSPSQVSSSSSNSSSCPSQQSLDASRGRSSSSCRAGNSKEELEGTAELPQGDVEDVVDFDVMWLE